MFLPVGEVIFKKKIRESCGRVLGKQDLQADTPPALFATFEYAYWHFQTLKL